jgi:transposase
MIHDLHRQGLAIQEIARATGHDRKTVRKYLKAGLEPPVYGPRAPRGSLLDPYKEFIRERLQATPRLTAVRLDREIRERGYRGGHTIVKDFVRQVRPAPPPAFERRFETAPGKQAQVDFAHFRVPFADQPDQERVVWLFSLVLGFSRYLFARFVPGQGMAEVVRCHLAAFAALDGVPREILYDRMKTAVLGEDEAGRVVFNETLLDLARHHGFTPRACKPYRAKTKGKVERPFRYIRQDFFRGRTFHNLDDLNRQLADWLDRVANPRIHGTTGRVVSEAFAEEKPALGPLPPVPFRALLALERRITKDGMVSLDGNLYSVPDGTRKRAVEVQVLPGEIRILEDGIPIAIHPPLNGRGRRSLLKGHRTPPHNQAEPTTPAERDRPVSEVGLQQRPLEVYDQVADALAGHAPNKPGRAGASP